MKMVSCRLKTQIPARTNGWGQWHLGDSETPFHRELLGHTYTGNPGKNKRIGIRSTCSGPAGHCQAVWWPLAADKSSRILFPHLHGHCLSVWQLFMPYNVRDPTMCGRRTWGSRVEKNTLKTLCLALPFFLVGTLKHRLLEYLPWDLCSWEQRKIKLCRGPCCIKECSFLPVSNFFPGP